ncbi:MAG TPA: hypothetical protein VL882_21360 [Vicinamibacterales bacterium]|nr:hypothetical protein [Vicinamibacterales bacterium]
MNLHTQPWSHIAQLLVSHRLQAMQTTLGVLATIVLGYRFVLLVITFYTA